MNVFIMGFMGSGKTSIGKALAKKMQLAFVDMDQDIEANEKQSIPSMFEEQGESAFRNLETKWLENCTLKNTVISVGGGTPCFNRNLNIMKKLGVVVYITISAEMIANRLIHSNTIRPIIEPYRHDFSALLNFVNGLLNERTFYYKQADLIFEASNMSASKYKLLTKMVLEVMNRKQSILENAIRHR